MRDFSPEVMEQRPSTALMADLKRFGLDAFTRKFEFIAEENGIIADMEAGRDTLTSKSLRTMKLMDLLPDALLKEDWGTDYGGAMNDAQVTSFHTMCKRCDQKVVMTRNDESTEVGGVLNMWGLAQYTPTFLAHNVNDAETLCDLQKDDLKDMEIDKVGHQLKILRCISMFRASESAYF